MTVRAILGLLALNVLYLGVGAGLFWALRGWRTWIEFVRFAGLAYVLGVAALGTAWTMLLVAGVPSTGWTIVLTCVAVGAIGLGAGWRPGRVRPSVGSLPTLTPLSLVSAAGIALAAVFLEALFRAARLHGLVAFDAWEFWVPKAKAIYEFGGLDGQLLAQLANPTYPPLVPLVDAAAFHAMGSADVVTLHLQYWFFTVGFAAAVAGLLWRRVPAWILWPFLLLVLAAPRMSVRLVTPQADFLLQFLFCTAVVLAALWLLERSSWQIVAMTVLLGGAVLTKREGTLLAAILLVALAVASLDRWRFAWPRIALSLVAVAAVSVPWRLWYRDRGIGGEAPSDVDVDFGRVRDALRLSVEVFFDTSLWSVLAFLAVSTVVLAAAWGSRRLALLLGLVVLLIVLGGAWITVAYPELQITADEALNPIVRYTASAVLVGGVVAPLLLGDVWRRSSPDEAAAR